MTLNHGLEKLGVLIACFAISAPASFAQDGLTTPTPSARQTIIEAYGKRPLSFERNMGQTDERVKFLARGPGYNVFLTGSEAVLSLQEELAADRPQPATIEAAEREHHAKPSKSTFLRMAFVGANPNPEVVGLEELPGKSNYLIGNDRSKWHTDVPTFAKVKYQGVYPGVDLVYYGNQRQLEYDFVITRGADPSRIRVSFEGATQLRVDDPTGDLLVTTESGSEVRHARPKVYQQVGSRQVEVAGGYHVLDSKHAAFTLAAYDRRHALVIDPTVSFTKVLEGSGSSVGTAIAVDSSGNAYVTGYTWSSNFPIVNAVDPYFQGPSPFVTKLSSTGTILFSTYWGGSSDDYTSCQSRTYTSPCHQLGIAVDSTGVFISGYTKSHDFPGTRISPKQSGSGRTDAFVTKFSLDGQKIYSLVLGGSYDDQATAIAVDTSHSAYITGFTHSQDFPLAVFGSWASSGATPSRMHVFVAKVDPSGNLVNSIYIGGSVWEQANGIAVNPSGSVWITGQTASMADFPDTVNGLCCRVQSRTTSIFVSRINSTFDGFNFSTLFGGGWGWPSGTAIAVDAADNAYVTGNLGHDAVLPTADEAFQPYPTIGIDCAFVAKLDPSGRSNTATYLCGNDGNTYAWAIAVHGAGDIYVAGQTFSTSFPAGAPPSVPNPLPAGFVVKFTPFLEGQPESVNYTQFIGAAIIGVAVYQPYSRYSFVRPTYPQVYTVGVLAQDAFVAKLDETPRLFCCAGLP